MHGENKHTITNCNIVHFPSYLGNRRKSKQTLMHQSYGAKQLKQEALPNCYFGIKPATTGNPDL